MKRPEQEIQIALLDHVRARSMPGVFFFHVPNTRKVSWAVGRINKRLGIVAGVPDLIFLYRSQVFGLELKAGKGKRPSEAQTVALNAMEVAGARTAVARSLEEGLTTLEYWGLLRRDQKFQFSEGQPQRSAT